MLRIFCTRTHSQHAGFAFRCVLQRQQAESVIDHATAHEALICCVAFRRTLLCNSKKGLLYVAVVKSLVNGTLLFRSLIVTIFICCSHYSNRKKKGGNVCLVTQRERKLWGSEKLVSVCMHNASRLLAIRAAG